MTEVLQTNIFFFITGLAILLFTALLCVLVYHLIKISKSVRRIMERVEAGAESLTEEVHQIRSHLRGGGVVRKVVRFLFAKGRTSEGEVMEEEDDTATHTRDRKRGGLKDKD